MTASERTLEVWLRADSTLFQTAMGEASLEAALFEMRRSLAGLDAALGIGWPTVVDGYAKRQGKAWTQLLWTVRRASNTSQPVVVVTIDRVVTEVMILAVCYLGIKRPANIRVDSVLTAAAEASRAYESAVAALQVTLGPGPGLSVDG